MRLPAIFHKEPQADLGGPKLNWLRAAVLGANDGIVSVAAVIVGVAGASNVLSHILVSGVAALSAGALSMAVGEYVSVSAQRDTEKALLEKERRELEEMPEEELEELAAIYRSKGISDETSHVVARELTAHDALAAHAEAELHIDPKELTNPWHAAFASGISFLVGGVLPLLAVSLPTDALRVPTTFAAVFVALFITGFLSAHAGGANKMRAVIRNVAGGILAMVITFGIGILFGVATA